MLPVAFVKTETATASALAFAHCSGALYTSCQETTARAVLEHRVMLSPLLLKTATAYQKTSHYHLCLFGASNAIEME